MSALPAQYLVPGIGSPALGQRTLDGRVEPLLDTSQAAPVREQPPRDVHTRPLPFDQYEPRSVRACRENQWHMQLWKKDSPAEKVRAPFRCKSWRCQTCRRGVAASDFARISAALGSVPLGEIVFAVFTLNQSKDAAEGLNKRTAYERLERRMQSLRQRLQRQFGERIRYVSTVEQHKSGWPHVNVIFHAPALAKAIEAEPQRADGLAPGWLRKAATSCGLGHMATAQAPRGSSAALAGYIVKLAHQDGLSVGTGEVVKLSQLPVTAPKGFRRLRASRGFLSKRMKQEGFSGALVREPLEVGLAADAWRDESAGAYQDGDGAEILRLASRHVAAFPKRSDPPQGAPKGAEGVAKPATGASGGGRSACLVTTRTSHSAAPRSWLPKSVRTGAKAGAVSPAEAETGPPAVPRGAPDGEREQRAGAERVPLRLLPAVAAPDSGT